VNTNKKMTSYDDNYVNMHSIKFKKYLIENFELYKKIET